MAEQHTPGPWGTELQREGIVIFTENPDRYAAGTHEIALVNDGLGSEHDDEPEANAKLIAAAPAMLEALQALTEFWDNNTPERPATEIVTQIRGAVAGATR